MYVLCGACIVVVLVLQLNVDVIESLECFTCTSARNLTECVTVKVCSSDEHCFTNVTGHGANMLYTLGCMNAQTCLAPVTTPSPIQTIIGRDVQDTASNCNQCCHSDYCNRKLCSHLVDVPTDQSCSDDADYNCELISSTFNICQDTNHAKVTCRKWCGLCDLVDGAWSKWTSWTNCDVSCSSGHKSRTRTCTNPKPGNGGLHCIGDSKETTTCTLSPCPVHGHWSLWSIWGTCGVSCGMGLQRRDRSCSNPYPGPKGSHCFGDARDDRVCFVKACADGNWSPWGSWGVCSTTCGGGLKERNRLCNNPSPSRSGQWCTGNSIVYVSCNTKACPVQLVYFEVNTPSKALVSGRPIFRTTVANIGAAYNQITGLFVSPTSGLYHFYISYTISSQSSVYCGLYHNNQVLTRAWAAPSTTGYKHTSASVYVELSKGDTFYVGSCVGWGNVYSSDVGMFTGALIHAS